MKTCIEFPKKLYEEGLEQLKNYPRTQMIELVRSISNSYTSFFISELFLSFCIIQYAGIKGYKTNIKETDTMQDILTNGIVFIGQTDVIDEHITQDELKSLVSYFTARNSEVFVRSQHLLFSHNIASRSRNRQSQYVQIETDLVNLFGKEILFPIQYTLFSTLPLNVIKSYCVDIIYTDKYDSDRTDFFTILNLYNVLESYLTQFHELKYCDYLQQTDIDEWVKELRELHLVLYPIKCRVQKENSGLISYLIHRSKSLVKDELFWTLLVIINIPLFILTGILIYVF